MRTIRRRRTTRIPANAADPGQTGLEAQYNGDILQDLADAAMILARNLGIEIQDRTTPSKHKLGRPPMTDMEVALAFERLSHLVRHSILTQLELPVTNPDRPDDDSRERAVRAIEAAIEHSARTPRTAAAYSAALSKRLEARDAPPDLRSQSVASVIAEFCCELGLIAQTVPAHWARPFSREIKRLTTRAAAAAIRPSTRLRPRHGPKPDRDPVAIVQAVIHSMATWRDDVDDDLDDDRDDEWDDELDEDYD